MTPVTEAESADNAIQCSIVVPFGSNLSGLDARLDSYGERLGAMSCRWEVLLVVEAERAADAGALVHGRPWLSTCQVSGPGWGRAVAAGLQAAHGETLCYLNWERTSANALGQILDYALVSPELVFRANRRTRDTTLQRGGSLLFNLQCRALLGTGAWDVNGTPKVFGRRHVRLLEIHGESGLYDAEFALVCEREGYPVAEVPIDADPLPGHVPANDFRQALSLYLGVFRLARDAR